MPKLTKERIDVEQAPAKGSKTLWAVPDEGEDGCVTGFGIRIYAPKMRGFMICATRSRASVPARASACRLLGGGSVTHKRGRRSVMRTSPMIRCAKPWTRSQQ